MAVGATGTEAGVLEEEGGEEGEEVIVTVSPC